MTLKRRLLIFFLIILFLAVLAYFYPLLTGNATNNFQPENAHVDKVIDGDTIVVSGPEIGNATHIRFLGMNTPEHGQPYCQEAADYVTEQIENKTIQLQRDGPDKDQYGRTLRYIFYNNRLINLELVEKGLAPTLMIDNLTYKDKFIQAENFARNNGLRLWQKSTDPCADCIQLEKLDPINEFFIIKNICAMNCNLNNWFVKDDSNHFFYLNNLNAGQEEQYSSILAKDSSGKLFSKTKVTNVWNNDKDRLFMRDDKGSLVIFYEYGY